MTSSDKDPDDRTALENLEIVANYVHRTTHWEKGRPDHHDAIQALNALPDQIDWIERGIVEWRDTAFQASKGATMARATARVAITHLQTILNGRLDANQMFDAEKAARDWLESIGEEP